MELNENTTTEHQVANLLHVDFSQVSIAKPRDGEQIEVRVKTHPQESIGNLTAETRAELSRVLNGASISIIHPQRDDLRVIDGEKEENDLALAA